MTTKLLCLLSLMMLGIPAQALPLVAGTSITGPNFGLNAKSGLFNADTNLDFLMVEGGTGKVHVYLGDGTGLFTHSVINFAPAVTSIGKVLVRDMNGDTKLDLVIEDQRTTGNAVYVSLGNGLAGFGPLTTPIFTAVPNVTGLHFADMDNDTNQDIIMHDRVNNAIVVYYYNGTTYSAPQSFPTGGNTNPQSVFDLQSGDLNGDGKTDLTVTLGIDNQVGVFLGNGLQTLAAAVTYPAGTAGAFGSVLADFNGDNRPDLAISDSNRATANAPTSNLSVLFNNGFGGFVAATQLPVSSNVAFVAAADFNMDGNMDLVTAPTGKIAVLAGDGAGGFAAPVEYASGLASSGIFSNLVGDINNDTYPDVIATALAGAASFATSIVPLINTIPAATGITGTMTINNNDAATEAARVTLQLSCVTAASAPCASTTTMEFSNDNTTWSTAVPIAASVAWTTSPGFGVKTVNARFTDVANNTSTVSDTIELIAGQGLGGGGCLAPTQSGLQYLLMLFALLLVSAQIMRSRKA